MTKLDPAHARRGVRTLRCAIYTRKSSEEGLGQDFNSLHAQREACAAFIKSQKHEGWTCLPEAYDDGGISGATMDRPALGQLLADIRAGRIDVVVVYKVDRLTRSLADFAKIVDIFDGRNVSFVSVTQQFNTTTSMGRLTLNVLLSFAQFEREVTGERIRDKIAASKKKGMWMGGVPPLGYDAKDRKLVVNEREAKTVRHVFQNYVALGSVRLLKQALDAHGILSKKRMSAAGRRSGARAFTRGALYLMLQNRIYLGEIVHKDQHYPGEHAPIIDRGLWDQVQALLAGNAMERNAGTGSRSPSLLAGLIFDGDGNRMTPTHAVKHGKRYRYYISRPLTTEGRQNAPNASRVPAAEIEQLVGNRIRQLLSEAATVFDAVGTHVHEPAEQKHLVDRATELARTWPELLPARARSILCALISRIELNAEGVEIHLLRSRVAAILQDDLAAASDFVAPEDRIIVFVPAQLKRIGPGTKLIIDGVNGARSKPDSGMIRLLVKAHQLQQNLLQGKKATIVGLANQRGLTGSYFTRLLRLAWLAPDITQAILDGRHPPALTAVTLMRGSLLPLDWPAQREALGFA